MYFWCLQFSQKTNENNSTLGTVVVKSNFLINFLWEFGQGAIFILRKGAFKYLFVFWENWRHQKYILKLTDLYKRWLKNAHRWLFSLVKSRFLTGRLSGEIQNLLFKLKVDHVHSAVKTWKLYPKLWLKQKTTTWSYSQINILYDLLESDPFL